MQHIAANNQKHDQTILIVEDDSSIGEMLIQALTLETPYDVLLVNNGFQALQIAKERQLCLFITDYRLPLMNGMELYDRLCASQMLKDTPAILMSAYLPPDEEIQKRHLLSVSKPFELDEMLDLIEMLIEAPAGGDRNSASPSCA